MKVLRSDKKVLYMKNLNKIVTEIDYFDLITYHLFVVKMLTFLQCKIIGGFFWQGRLKGREGFLYTLRYDLVINMSITFRLCTME